MNYKQMLEKFQAIEDQLWEMSERIAELEKQTQKQPADGENWFKKLMEQGN
jgi:cytochrome c-type biogenesis protein CcmH/NrfG